MAVPFNIAAFVAFFIVTGALHFDDRHVPRMKIGSFSPKTTAGDLEFDSKAHPCSTLNTQTVTR